MSISTWSITRQSMILWEGDSKSDPAFPYQMLNTLFNAVTYNYRLPETVNGQIRYTHPTVVNKAVNGSRISDVNGRIASELTQNQYTHVVLCIGTNERTVVRANTQSDISSLMSKFTTQQLLVIGPYAWGEKYPSGQNDVAGANDQRLDETDTDLSTLVPAGYANSLYISLRTTLYAVTMPPLNQPPPGVTSGPFTTPDTSGAHDNGTSRLAVYNLIKPSINFG